MNPFRLNSIRAASLLAVAFCGSLAAQTNISVGLPSTASSVQGTSVASQANDGNTTTTRWTASAGTFPQWWRVDLGTSRTLSRVDIAWYSTTTRAYKYRVEVSPDDVTYTTAVDKTANTVFGDTSDSFIGTGRYVRVTVTGATTGFASAYEISVFGSSGGGAVPVVTSASTLHATVGTALAYLIQASNSPTSFTATGLPTGLSLNASNGYIVGTPTATGTTTATIGAANANGAGPTASLVITTAAAAPTAPVITSALDVSGTVGVPFTYQIVATNSPTSYAVTGALPAGLSVNATTGLVTGTPTSATTANTQPEAANSVGTGSALLVITIAPSTPAAPSINSTLSKSGEINAPLGYQITATNNPTSFSATGLPAGLTMDSSGYISGTPTSVATTTAVIKATNSVGTSTAKNLVLTVAAAVIPAVPTRMTVIPVSTSQINVTWNAVWGATAYDIQQDGVTVSSVSRPYTSTGLLASSNHTYAVRARNSAGSSAFSTTVTAPTQAATGSVIPLFDSSTALEVETVIDTPTALITNFGDRARDRHCREATFASYDHYLIWYWEARTAAIQIVDKVAKGGNEVDFNYTTQWPLNAPEFRAFFRGVNTVAEYYTNLSATRIDPTHYTAKVTTNSKLSRAIQVGDNLEIEVSQFLASPIHGRPNYYGSAVLYVVGQGGMVPWEGLGTTLDSSPLDEKGWLGGRTTLPYQYSNEPLNHFKETASNIAPGDTQPFMLGRRLQHTDFGDGSHAEAGNPIYAEQVGKLGPQYTGRSCFACHTDNGRALAPVVGAMMLKSVVRVGSSPTGDPHPNLGNTLQQLSTAGTPEAGVSISSWTTINGTYGDGTAYTLRKPNYAFTGVVPLYYSVRLAPQLVGSGLLEAVPEGEIAALADPNDTNGDGISGKMQTVTDPQTGQLRMGRFGWKAGQPSLKLQIASALDNDMGVTTSIFQNLDRGSTQVNPGPSTELSDSDLDNLYRYNATLGVSARRSLTDPQALQGEALFTSASCVKCHVATLTTSPYHPLTELRSQTIHPYTDLLLHDMGTGLADNMGEGAATGAEWRTSPLWSIGLTAGVSGGEGYLHDGRARDLSEAILWHGGEAQASEEAFRTMSASDRAALIAFLQSL